jgi:hypothetical protein
MRPQSRKLFIVGVVFMLLAAACGSGAPTLTPTPGPLDLVQAFQRPITSKTRTVLSRCSVTSPSGTTGYLTSSE